ncbi:hypothetical protein OROMI_023236 [Orobanche minor]
MIQLEIEGHEDKEVVVEEEVYVLLDFNNIFDHIHIPPNAPYVLSFQIPNPYGEIHMGLDTLNPILLIDNKIKLGFLNPKGQGRVIGEYGETIGTCLVLNENDVCPIVHKEVGPSEANLFSGRCIIDPNQTAAKQVNPVTSLHKVLKFRLLLEADNGDGTGKQAAEPTFDIVPEDTMGLSVKTLK